MINECYIDKYRGFDIIMSHKYKFIYCLIQKNGSSSILNSVLNYEYGFNYNDPNGIIWDYIKYNYHLVESYYNQVFMSFIKVDDLKNYIKQYPDYRKFIVMNDPYKRFVSWLNFFQRIHFNKVDLDFGLSLYNYINDNFNKIFIDKYYNGVTTVDDRVEYHCLSQDIFYDFFHKAIGDELELVDLKDLKNYCKQNFDFDLIINNQSKDKFITLDCIKHYDITF